MSASAIAAQRRAPTYNNDPSPKGEVAALSLVRCRDDATEVRQHHQRRHYSDNCLHRLSFFLLFVAVGRPHSHTIGERQNPRLSPPRHRRDVGTTDENAQPFHSVGRFVRTQNFG